MEVLIISQAIFKRDSKGQVRTWWYETGYDTTGRWAWRTNSGLMGGKIVTSEWRLVEEKNVGRANATTMEMQADSEAHAEMTKKLKDGYFQRIEDIDTFDKTKAMLAIKWEDAKIDFEKNEYYSQPKLDGIRCIARKDGLWTRGFKPILSCDHIIQELSVFFEQYPDAILDGELYNHDLKQDFEKIVSLVRKTKSTEEDMAESAKLVQYHVYDMAVCPREMKDEYGEDPFFSDRISWFYNQGFDGASPVKIVKTRAVSSFEVIDELYGKYTEDEYEGQMIRVNDVYQGKRSKFLIKRKEFMDQEFEVIRTEEGQGNWAGYVKRFVIKLEDGRECGAGVRGNQETLKKLFEEGNTPDWATVRYFELTSDGVPRFPVVTDWGWGKRED